jgi:peroxiredoxin
MTSAEPRPIVQVGQPAPDLTLPAISRDGQVTLADFRGRSPVLLAINRGLWCPFCRRALVQLGATAEKLRALGVETVAVVASGLDRARLYLRYRPSSLLLAADPDLTSHRTFGLPKPALTPELLEAAQSVRINPYGDLAAPVPVLEAVDVHNARDSFQLTDVDRHEMQSQFSGGPQLTGQFLIDRAGIVRWLHVECADEGLAGAGKFPSDEQFLAAARALPA